MLTNSVSIQTLLTQFQTRYPAGSVISELLVIHESNFVVRAVVQVGSVTLATALASAANVEQAEDRAKVRVLSALGLGSFGGSMTSPGLAYSLPAAASFESVPTPAPSESSPPIASQAVPQPPFTDRSSDNITPISTPPLSSSWRSGQDSGTPEIAELTPPGLLDQVPGSSGSSKVVEPVSFPDESFDPGADQAAIEDLDFSPDSEPSPEPPHPQPDSASESGTIKPSKPTTRGKSTKRKTESATESAPIPEIEAIDRPPQEIVDRSDVNAKIGVEMKRLSWTVEQGRNHLKRTYGKRSRQELEDSELLDFLNYLEDQPMPTNAPF